MGDENGEDSSVMRIGKRCYVGNLAWKTSWQDLKDKFRDVGNVVYANVMRDDGGRTLFRPGLQDWCCENTVQTPGNSFTDVCLGHVQVDQRGGVLSSSNPLRRSVYCLLCCPAILMTCMNA